MNDNKLPSRKLKKLNKIVKLLLKGKSLRSIEILLKTDRFSIRKWFYGIIPCSVSYSEKILKLAIKNNYTYMDLLKRFGKRGLSALYHWVKNRQKDSTEKLAKKVLKLRKLGLTYREISELTKKGISYLQKITHKKYGKKSLIGNVVFHKINKRDEMICEDYKRGDSISVIAARYKKSPITVRNILHDKFGISLKQRSIAFRYFDKIQFLRSKNFNWKEIAFVIGGTPQRIQRSYSEELFRRTINEKIKSTGC